MPAQKFKCPGCGSEGEIGAIGRASPVKAGVVFGYLGHHEFTGNMYFLCPRCSWEAVVDPAEVPEPPVIRKSYLPPYAVQI
ncbi:MAG: hypothetical protein ABFD62_15715 [Syntrophaceae bacterium]